MTAKLNPQYAPQPVDIGDLRLDPTTKGGLDDVLARVFGELEPGLLRKLGADSTHIWPALPESPGAGGYTPLNANGKHDSDPTVPSSPGPASPLAVAPETTPGPTALSEPPTEPAPVTAADSPGLEPTAPPEAPPRRDMPVPLRGNLPATDPATSSTEEPLEFNDIEDVAAVLADNFASVSSDGKSISAADLEKLKTSSKPALRAAAEYIEKNPAEWRELNSKAGGAGMATLDELNAPSASEDDGTKVEYNSVEDAASVLSDNFKSISPDGKGIDQVKLKELAKHPDATIAGAAEYMLKNPEEWKQVASTWGGDGVATAAELTDAFDENVDNMDLDPAAHALNKNWEKLDPEGDGIDENDLRRAMADDTSSPELRAAAKYLLENPDELAEMKNTMGGTNGMLSRANVEQYLADQSDAEAMDPYTVAATLRANFATISPDGAPLSMAKLKEIANKGATPDLREAARYLLNNPQDFQAADTALGEGATQTISFAELGAAMDAGSEPMGLREAGLALKKHWAALDPKGEGISKEQLIAVANDPKQPDEVQKAARFVLANPGTFDGLDTMSSPNADMRITLGDVELAAAGFDPENMDHGATLDTLMKQFDKFKGADGNITLPDDLKRVLNDPNAPPELRVAAATVLRTPEMQTDLENLAVNGGQPDGKVSFADVRALWETAHPDPNLENMSNARIYEIAIANFGALAGDDGQIEQEDLRRIQRDPNASREVRAMADQLLNGAGEDGAAGDLFRRLAMTGGGHLDNNRVCLQELKMALEDETMAPMTLGDTIAQLQGNFDKYVDPEVGGRYLTKSSLQRMALDQSATPQLRQAAKLLLANPDMFQKLDEGNHGKGADGRIGTKDLAKALNEFGGEEFSKPASRWGDAPIGPPIRGEFDGRTAWGKFIDA